MATAARGRGRGGRARAALRERLEARREEIETAALTRVSAIADPSEVVDPVYAEGLRVAVTAAVAFGIETTGREGSDPPIPVMLLAQARMAARVGIPLDTVLRRYFAGYSLLGYFILEEATHAGLTDGDELKRLLGAHAGIFDRLLAAIGEEHARETESLALATGARRRAERIERLLSGEPVDTSEIPYDFEGWHVGAVAEGGEVEPLLRALATKLDCRLLTLPREDGVTWAWLGSRRRLDPAVALGELSALVEAKGSSGLAIALGEPAEEAPGWRLTHRQASAALPVVQRGPERAVRYADVALLAAALGDELLAGSLRRLFLEPLEAERDGGAVLCETLRAYFAADRNLTSAAATLGVNRSTVSYRLQTAEARLGRPLVSCMAELEVALR